MTIASKRLVIGYSEFPQPFVVSPVEPAFVGSQIHLSHDLCAPFDGAQDERITMTAISKTGY